MLKIQKIQTLKIGVHSPFDPNFGVGIGNFCPEKFRQALCKGPVKVDEYMMGPPLHWCFSALVSEQMETSKEYQQLIEYGLDAKVAGRLDEIFKTGEESYHLTFDELLNYTFLSNRPLFVTPISRILADI